MTKSKIFRQNLFFFLRKLWASFACDVISVLLQEIKASFLFNQLVSSESTEDVVFHETFWKSGFVICG